MYSETRKFGVVEISLNLEESCYNYVISSPYGKMSGEYDCKIKFLNSIKHQFNYVFTSNNNTLAYEWVNSCLNKMNSWTIKDAVKKFGPGVNITISARVGCDGYLFMILGASTSVEQPFLCAKSNIKCNVETLLYSFMVTLKHKLNLSGEPSDYDEYLDKLRKIQYALQELA